MVLSMIYEPSQEIILPYPIHKPLKYSANCDGHCVSKIVFKKVILPLQGTSPTAAN